MSDRLVRTGWIIGVRRRLVKNTAGCHFLAVLVTVRHQPCSVSRRLYMVNLCLPCPGCVSSADKAASTMSMPSALRTVCLVGITLLTASSLRLVRMDAAAAPPPAQAATRHPAPASRSLLDKYCVTCHNARLKTAGVMFDTVDTGRLDAHRELFEKVARKLHSGQMPPQDRPRPDQAAVTAFLAALEAELDRVGAAAPDPGRVVSHRLNRTEYVNVIRDLLALEIDGAALLPSDMAGFGFDNNAEVLSMTPALMDRYMTAATKVSRLAVGTLENRPAILSYRVPQSARQGARMGEELPFATHGGLAVRHTFSLDGDYVFKLRLRRGEGGNDSRQHRRTGVPGRAAGRSRARRAHVRGREVQRGTGQIRPF